MTQATRITDRITEGTDVIAIAARIEVALVARGYAAERGRGAQNADTVFVDLVHSATYRRKLTESLQNLCAHLEEIQPYREHRNRIRVESAYVRDAGIALIRIR